MNKSVSIKKTAFRDKMCATVHAYTQFPRSQCMHTCISNSYSLSTGNTVVPQKVCIPLYVKLTFSCPSGAAAESTLMSLSIPPFHSFSPKTCLCFCLLQFSFLCFSPKSTHQLFPFVQLLFPPVSFPALPLDGLLCLFYLEIRYLVFR